MKNYASRRVVGWAIVVLLMGLFAAGCTTMVAPVENATEEMPAMAPEPGKITVMNARSRPSPMAGGNGAAYLVVLNGLDTDVQLTGAATAAADVVELHETVEDNGVMRMIPQPDGFTVPAGGSVELKPGGKHVMMIGLAKPLETGDEFELTLNFDNGESMTLTVPVADMSGEMPMNMDHGDMEQEDTSESSGD
ncbi:MAG: copper chaperone PCu(A)C [Caldilineaceae bacterium]|nr:copper chaperone PCu(A)C [Caldilineaceae bacterium]